MFWNHLCRAVTSRMSSALFLDVLLESAKTSTAATTGCASASASVLSTNFASFASKIVDCLWSGSFSYQLFDDCASKWKYFLDQVDFWFIASNYFNQCILKAVVKYRTVCWRSKSCFEFLVQSNCPLSPKRSKGTLLRIINAVTWQGDALSPQQAHR